MTTAPYALPLRIALAYVYFEDEPMRRRMCKRLSGEDAKAVAQTIARPLTARADGAADDGVVGGSVRLNARLSEHRPNSR